MTKEKEIKIKKAAGKPKATKSKIAVKTVSKFTKKTAIEKAVILPVPETPVQISAPDVGPVASSDFEEEILTPEQLEKAINAKPDGYYEAIGKRKTAIARVRLFTRGEKVFLVNGKNYKNYFPTASLQMEADASMRKMKCSDRFRIIALVRGGGEHSQAEAVKLGTARALVKFNSDFRKRLRRAGFLTRDARIRERKKFGLKRARRAPQWSKR